MLVTSGVVLPAHVGSFVCNLLRKATSTAMHEITSDSMSNSQSTAQAWFHRPDTVIAQRAQATQQQMLIAPKLDVGQGWKSCDHND